MKTILYIVLSAQLMTTFGLGQDKSYEVPIFIVRRGQVNQAVENIEVMPERYGGSQIFGASPGRTNAQGKAVIRFQSPKETVKLHYRVAEGPDGNQWYVKFHGFYPDGTADLPPHGASASPASNPELKMEAYPATEAANVAAQELAEGRSAMIGAAVASAVTLPAQGGQGIPTPGGTKLNDPLRSYKHVADILKTTPENAKTLVEKWQEEVAKAPPMTKLDEKSLAALVSGDIGKATEFARQAEGLSGDRKQELGVISDTGRLIETIYQFNVAVQDNSDGPPNQAVERRLKELEQEIKPLRPKKDGRSPASHFDASDLDAFSKTARERASRF